MRFGLKTIILVVLAAIAIGASLNYSNIRDFATYRTAVCADGLECLDQGWSDVNRNWWYTTSQGSRLLPLSWFKALETPQSTETAKQYFGSTENLTRLGYLASPVSPSNPDGLPVGFTVDHDGVEDKSLTSLFGMGARAQDGEPPMCARFPETCKAGTLKAEWVGMNCSACHTNDIEFEGKRVRVEGAPTLADFQNFELEMLASLEATKSDRAKFDRFAASVLPKTASAEQVADLEKQLEEQTRWYEALKAINASDVEYGRGRLDAQGHILNKVVLAAGQAGKVATVRADAPASYPHIWNTSQQTRIQWNGIATNKGRVTLFGNETDFGALIRNTTEVIGVFAQIDVDSGKAVDGYNSTARAKNLIGLERQLKGLQSPRWPESFPPLNTEKVKRGRQLFEEEREIASGGKASCSGCHSHMEPDDIKSKMKEVMTPISQVRTDIFLACNTFLHETAPGNFRGQKVFGFLGDEIGKADEGQPEPNAVPTRLVLINSTVGTMRGKAKDIVAAWVDKIAPAEIGRKPRDFNASAYLPGATSNAKKLQALTCLKAKFDDNQDNILAYKARPLNGIWATAPYLHNGSVPTLYDLLGMSDMKLEATDPDRPANAAVRPDKFGVGSRKYDVVKAGFVSDLNDPDTTFEFNTKDATGAPIPGNYNSGHDYGTATLSEEDRMALVEYMKSL